MALSEFEWKSWRVVLHQKLGFRWVLDGRIVCIAILEVKVDCGAVSVAN